LKIVQLVDIASNGWRHLMVRRRREGCQPHAFVQFLHFCSQKRSGQGQQLAQKFAAHGM